MIWVDYRPIPGKNWADLSLVPIRLHKIALVAVDFPYQPFIITLPRKSCNMPRDLFRGAGRRGIQKGHDGDSGSVNGEFDQLNV